MDIITLSVYVIFAIVALCLVFLANRMLRPLIGPLMALGTDSDSLKHRVFPLLGFVGVAGILLKLTLFSGGPQ